MDLNLQKKRHFKKKKSLLASHSDGIWWWSSQRRRDNGRKRHLSRAGFLNLSTPDIWGKWVCRGGRPVGCSVFSGTAGLYSAPGTLSTRSQTITNVSRRRQMPPGGKCSWLRSTTGLGQRPHQQPLWGGCSHEALLPNPIHCNSSAHCRLFGALGASRPLISNRTGLRNAIQGGVLSGTSD